MRKFLISVFVILIIPVVAYAGFSFGLTKAVKKTGDKVDEKVVKKKAALLLYAQTPTVPTNFTAVAVSSCQINLSWTASTDDVGVTGYKVYRNGGATPIATPTGTTYSDTSLAVVTAYVYTVSACDAAGNCSAHSNTASATTPDTQVPTVPTNLTAVAVSSCQINLSWTASTDDVGVTSYKIYRDGGITPIATPTGTTYSNTGLVASTAYSYTASACDAAGNCSVQSAAVSTATVTPIGTQKWKFTTLSDMRSSPAIGVDSTVYVGAGDNKLYAINPDGSKKWEFATSSSVPSSPAIGLDGTIYFGSYNGKLYAINPNGSQKWEFATSSKVYSSPAIGSDGTIYFGSDNGKLYAINPNGSQKWEFTTGIYVQSSPAISTDSIVYVGSGDNKLYAINPDGSQKWAFATGSSLVSSPAIGPDGIIYIGSADNKLYAINPDGSQKWSVGIGNVVGSSPAVGPDGTVYVGSYNSMFYAFNPNGSQKWVFTTGALVHSSPAIDSDGTVYVGSSDNKLYAINPNGSQKWAFTTGSSVTSSPTIGLDGTVYVGSDDGKLYAIYGSGTLATTAWPKFHRDLENTGRLP
ncbi:MAG: PQQ-binding-like beta-propeller repeat protein [Elusimicrobiota bacterium]|nr:PQQ-binding-like beta-propeller repeat protein [Elusimicrobiota bacterium]